MVRQGLAADLDGLTLLGQSSREEFSRRMAAGDHCAVAVAGDRIVGYEWYSTRAYHMAEPFHYGISVPSDSIYAFDAHIVPEYRVRGVWLSLKKYLACLMRDLQRSRVLTYVEDGNLLSLRTHLRFGFKPYKKVFVVHVPHVFTLSI